MTKEANEIRRVYEPTYVRSLFDSIADRYDLLNHVLSTGIDVFWRRKAIQLIQPLHPKLILDVATGTGDLAIEACRLAPEQIVGIDNSSRMLDIAIKKIQSRKLENIIKVELGIAENMLYESNSFDVVMSAFGVRNFEDLTSGLSEFFRVIHAGGVALILEFSKPRLFPVKQIYKFYLNRILPLVGGIISKNRPAYNYLQSTITEFPDGEEFCNILRSVGFKTTKHFPLTYGIVSIYLASKE